MNIWHPLNAIPEGWPVWIAFVLLFVLAALAGRLTRQEALKTEHAPWSVISLELAAFKKGQAKEILDEWSEAGKLDLFRKHLFRDTFLFIPLYTTMLALGCVMAARVFHSQETNVSGFGLLLAWLAWVAGLLDLVENYAMWKMLDGFKGEGLPWLATGPATLKFILILATALYGLAGIGYRLFIRPFK